jgi:hypothetical protein
MNTAFYGTIPMSRNRMIQIIIESRH